jgi:hypothetical protein
MKCVSFKTLTLIVAVALTLSACGGGGGDDPAPASAAPVASVPQGVYGGTLTNGGVFDMLALENGEVWALYGTQNSSTFVVRGLVQGTFADAKDFGYAPALPVRVAAQYDAASKTMQGSIAASGSALVGFNGGPIAGSQYNYDQPASMSVIARSWITQASTGETLSFSVDGAGILNGSGSSGCRYSGWVAPRASGKNVFDVTVTFAGAPCTLAGQRVSGIAVAYALDLYTMQLVVGLVDALRTVGLTTVGTRM